MRSAIRLMAFALAALFGDASTAQAEPLSNAARYLMDEQVAIACEGPGSFREDQIITAELTGDGRGDLVLDHGLISCRPPSFSTRSLFCGIRAYSVVFSVREGALLVQKAEILSIGAELGVRRLASK